MQRPAARLCRSRTLRAQARTGRAAGRDYLPSEMHPQERRFVLLGSRISRMDSYRSHTELAAGDLMTWRAREWSTTTFSRVDSRQDTASHSRTEMRFLVNSRRSYVLASVQGWRASYEPIAAHLM